jgi:hypothetical protein
MFQSQLETGTTSGGRSGEQGLIAINMMRLYLTGWMFLMCFRNRRERRLMGLSILTGESLSIKSITSIRTIKSAKKEL